MLGEYTYVNDLYKRHFGHFYTDFIGENAMKSVHEDDITICEEAANKCLLNPNEVIEVNFRKPEHNGVTAYVKWIFFTIKNETGSILEIGCIGYNLTEQINAINAHKTTQEKLLAALNSSDESFYFLDKEMKVISFNQGAKNASSLFYNVTMHEGYDFKKSLLPGTEEGFYKQFNDALNGIESNVENEMIFPTGVNVWYKLNMKPAKDDYNNIIGVALSFINIDSIKKTALRLKEIAWHQSHKVRKPLSNILSLIDLLKENRGQPNNEIIDMLKSSALELDETIKQVVAKTLIDK